MHLGLGWLRRRKFWIVAAVLLGLYTGAGFWGIPRVMTYLVRSTAAERYHRQAQLGRVTFNPFTLELDVRSFVLPDADGGPLLSFDRLYVNLALYSVLRGGLYFQAITLESPRVSVVQRAGGSINLQDLVSRAASAQSPNTTEPDQPMRLWIDALTVREGKVVVIDQDRPEPLTLSLIPVTFTLRKFSTRSDGNVYALTMQTTRSERLTWRGTFGLSPLSSRGTFELNQLRLQTLAEIGAGRLPFAVTSGELALSGSYDLAQRSEALALRVDVRELVVQQCGIRPHGDDRDMLTIPKLTVSHTQVDLAQRSVSVDRIAVQDASTSVVRNKEGALNLARLMGRASRHPEPSVTASAPWNIALSALQLERATIEVVDHAAGSPVRYRIAPFGLRVGGLALPLNKPLDLQLEAAVADAGHIAVSGTLSVAPLVGQLQLDVSGFPLPPLQPYLDASTGLVLRRGTAELQGGLSIAADGGLIFHGKAGIADLETVDRGRDEDFIDWQKLELLGLRASNQPLSLAIDEVALRHAYARAIVRADGVTNIHDVLVPSTSEPHSSASSADAKANSPQPSAAGEHTASVRDAQPEKTASDAQAGLPIEIKRVRVEEGSLNFSDLSLKPTFATGVSHIAGTIAGLSSDASSRAAVDLAGEVDRYTPVRITGRMNYLSATTHAQFRLRFRNLSLTQLSPYSGKFAGYKIERGKLDVDLNYKIDDRRLEAKHKIVVSQLQLGDAVKSPDATSLPVKFAVSLLKDRNGVIDLDLPMRGNLDDPQFRIWPLVGKVVLNLLSKAVFAPFALLGSLFGGGEEISHIDFVPGSSALEPTAAARLQTLTKALGERPALNLDVPLAVEPKLDREALVLAAFRAKVHAQALLRLRKNKKAPHDERAVAKLLATPIEYRELLEDDYRKVFGKPALIPQPSAARPAQARAKEKNGDKPPPVPNYDAIVWLERQLKSRVPMQQPQLDALAQARAESVQHVLLDATGIDPARVFVITSASSKAEQGRVRMELSLH